MGTLWAILNQPAVMAIVIAVLGKLFETKVKSTTRRGQILAYADAAFHVANALPIPGAEKYLRYYEQIVNALTAAGEKPLSGPENKMLQDLAQTKALLSKRKAP